jgi:hypothetical protein
MESNIRSRLESGPTMGRAILGKIKNVPFLTKLGVNEGKELSFKYWDRMSTT